MKKTTVFLALVLISGSFMYKTSRNTNLVSSNCNLVDVSEITIKHAKAPKIKVKEFKKIIMNNNNEVKVITSKVPGYLVVTLRWGEKYSAGYTLKITEAKQYGDVIEIKYFTTSPQPGDTVLHVITFPQDTINVKVDRNDRNFKISLINVNK